MDYSRLSERLLRWKAEIRRNPEEDDRYPVSSPDWFAGLAVSPASFSRQLGDMQVAMLQANGVYVENPPRNTVRTAAGSRN